MIYVTGDMHGRLDMDKLYMRKFPEQKNLTKEDVVIICGDFGGIWTYDAENKKIIQALDNRRFTTVFCDGNHECYEKLNQFPVVEKFGGQVHKIGKSVYHLMRGEVFTIEGKTFFVMGGASSYDRPHIQGLGWWQEELPSICEMAHGIESLERVGWKVDYVITHCAPTSIQKSYIHRDYLVDRLTDYLDQIKDKLVFKNWYFGHYHVKRIMPDSRFQCLYKNIVPIQESGG